MVSDISPSLISVWFWHQSDSNVSPEADQSCSCNLISLIIAWLTWMSQELRLGNRGIFIFDQSCAWLLLLFHHVSRYYVSRSFDVWSFHFRSGPTLNCFRFWIVRLMYHWINGFFIFRLVCNCNKKNYHYTNTFYLFFQTNQHSNTEQSFSN